MRHPLNPVELFQHRASRAELFHRGTPENESLHAMGFASFLRFFYTYYGPPLFLHYDPGFHFADWMLVDDTDGPSETHLPLAQVSKIAVYLLGEHGFLGRDVAKGPRARRTLPISQRCPTKYPVHADVIEAGHWMGLRFLGKELEYDDRERDKIKDRVRFQARGRL